MRGWYMCILFGVASVQAQVQDAATPFSGMANSAVAVTSSWASFTNQAGIARLSGFSAGLSYRYNPALPELTTQAAFANLGSSRGVFSVSYVRFGYRKYREQLIGAAYGRTLASFLDWGIKAGFLWYEADKLSGRGNAFLVETGLIFILPENVRIGIRVCNPGDMARFTAPEGFQVDEIYSVGISWQPDTLFLLTLQADCLNEDYFYAAGIRYAVLPFMYAECGFRTENNRFSAGLGGSWRNVSAGLSYATNRHTGESVELTFGVFF